MKLNFFVGLEGNRRAALRVLEANFQLTCNWSLGSGSAEPKVNNCICRKNLLTKRWVVVVVVVVVVEGVGGQQWRAGALSRESPSNCLHCGA